MNAPAHKNVVRNVVRYGRYTLVELTPEVAQSDLMAQIIDVTIPLSQGIAETTVGEAMRYALQRSGYRLCEPSTAFNLLSLPVAHTHLGPMALRDAMAVLAGPAWKLQIDEEVRQVCFVTVSGKVQKQEVTQ
jgi:type IV pili sensor histidine kinase/response regulator